MKQVYLDHSATTQALPEVAKLVSHYMTEDFGNASSVHAFGRTARQAVDEGRQQVAVTGIVQLGVVA